MYSLPRIINAVLQLVCHRCEEPALACTVCGRSPKLCFRQSTQALQLLTDPAASSPPASAVVCWSWRQ